MFEEIDFSLFHDCLMRDGKRYINDLKHKMSKWIYGNVDLEDNGYQGIDIDISEYIKDKYSKYHLKNLMIIDGEGRYHQTVLYLNYNILECCLDSKKGFHELDKDGMIYLLKEMMKDIYGDELSGCTIYIIENIPPKGIGLQEYLRYIMENNDGIALE